MADGHLSDLRAEARYRRERFDLYKQKLYASGPLNLRRLRELRWAKEFAEGRLRRAESNQDDKPASGSKPG